jgi:Ycf4
MTTNTNDRILNYPILGARRFSNIFFAVIVAIGASGFLLTGLSSYFKVNLLPVADPIMVEFLPQGIALTFYGIAGTLLDLYLWFVIAIDLGSGFNQFNRDSGKIQIFRRGYLGKDRILDFVYEIADAQAVRVDLRNGLNPKRDLYLRLKGKGDIPLTEVGQPMSLSQLEDRAAELAKFLSIPLEGI